MQPKLHRGKSTKAFPLPTCPISAQRAAGSANVSLFFVPNRRTVGPWVGSVTIAAQDFQPSVFYPQLSVSGILTPVALPTLPAPVVLTGTAVRLQYNVSATGPTSAAQVMISTASVAGTVSWNAVNDTATAVACNLEGSYFVCYFVQGERCCWHNLSPQLFYVYGANGLEIR